MHVNLTVMHPLHLLELGDESLDALVDAGHRKTLGFRQLRAEPGDGLLSYPKSILYLNPTRLC